MATQNSIRSHWGDETSPRYFQSGTALHRIWSEAPYLPRCSDDKTATRVRPREYAIRYPYMQINRSGFVSWLIFDLDHSNAMIWEDAGLPAPNLIVKNRSSGHSHLYYAIPPVCTTESARSKPIAYMKAVYAAFAHKLKADLDFHSGPVAKTPGHRWWLTHELHPHVYELGELADYVDLPLSSPWGKSAQIDDASHSRHCILFEHVRHYAYSIVNKERESGSFENFVRALDVFAQSKNSFQRLGFAQDLGVSSLRATVKSVARWTWDRYRGGGGCHRGVMNLDPSLTLAQRQALAAKRTHQVRHSKTELKVREGISLLASKNEGITLMSIARVTGVSRQTVAKLKHLIEEAKNVGRPVVEKPIVNAWPQTIVKNAVYQVTAGLFQQCAFPYSALPLYDG